MKPPRPKACPTIFVGLDENRVPPVLIIQGITWPRKGELGRDGLGCIWKPEKNSWERVFSLKDGRDQERSAPASGQHSPRPGLYR